MEKIYLDYTILTAFFNRNSEFYQSAVNVISSLLLQQEDYFISPTHLFKAVEDLSGELQAAQDNELLPANFNVSEEVMKKVTEFCEKIKLKTIENANPRLLDQTMSIAKEYDVSMETANTMATLMDSRINIVASFRDDFDPLFKEGMLIQYQP